MMTWCRNIFRVATVFGLLGLYFPAAANEVLARIDSECGVSKLDPSLQALPAEILKAVDEGDLNKLKNNMYKLGVAGAECILDKTVPKNVKSISLEPMFKAFKTGPQAVADLRANRLFKPAVDFWSRLLYARTSLEGTKLSYESECHQGVREGKRYSELDSCREALLTSAKLLAAEFAVKTVDSRKRDNISFSEIRSSVRTESVYWLNSMKL